MNLQGHLLYIDITQICGIGCTFCMYADKHKSGISMELSTLARENLARLINSSEVKRISISGEGEPLNNYKVFHEILGLSKGDKCFEFITSGFYPHSQMADFYDETNRIVLANSDTCNIRLSADSHHIEKVKWKAHGFSLDYLRKSRPLGLSFSFRSIDTDREFTREFLMAELALWDLEGTIDQRSILADDLLVDGERYGIDYKNLVHPSQGVASNYLDMFDYIKAIESKVSKPFTFGSLNKSPNANGLDVTVKPSGDVYLYGIETQRLGNIHFDYIDWCQIVDYVQGTPLPRALYTQPFTELLERIDNTDQLNSIISKVNNPYWLIKEMTNHAELFDQWSSL